jgi:tRNA 2-thiouridine synthesizing protein E
MDTFDHGGARFLLLPDQRRVALDEDGYLRSLEDWNDTVAGLLAREAGIELTPAHWEVLLLLRQFHSRFGLSPAMRPLVRFAAQMLGTEKGRSVYLLSLFPGNAALLGARIAGLPRPENCF